jgi:universal stress protein A
MNFDELKLILVPTDFSEVSSAALRTAIRLAKTFHAALDILHVDPDPTFVMPPPGDLLTVPLVMDSVLAASAERLERAAEEVRRAGVTCTTATEVGRTHVEIVDRARRLNVGLIVMGTHGRHGLSHVLLGSVAEKVVQQAPCSVLVVPPTDDKPTS